MENRIQNRIWKAQKQFAEFLNNQFNKLSLGFQKACVICFGLAIGSLCGLLIARSLSGKSNAEMFSVADVSKPITIHSPERLGLNPDQEYMNILHYKRFLDSLKITNDPLYDTILLHHPGLKDSIDLTLGRIKKYK